ncbi:DUF86 domain-containing protein [Peribacillus sp. SCS-37]|uniref:DUF86 domain-containing protein n=1 Tax=Paraperibacillus esterisolvens TaxID=3115296 RepID=UPI003906A99A
MYFVDREKIEQTLRFLENQINMFEEVSEGGHAAAGSIKAYAAQRVSQTMIDAVLDVGNAMIDGFIMRDPGSFEDIIDILEDEAVLDSGMAQSFRMTIPLRKMLIQDYVLLSQEELMSGMQQAMPAYKTFPGNIRDYLLNELGPVSAFKNE